MKLLTLGDLINEESASNLKNLSFRKQLQNPGNIVLDGYKLATYDKIPKNTVVYGILQRIFQVSAIPKNKEVPLKNFVELLQKAELKFEMEIGGFKFEVGIPYNMKTKYKINIYEASIYISDSYEHRTLYINFGKPDYSGETGNNGTMIF